jgi:DNA-binding transcriptional regulator YiaG
MSPEEIRALRKKLKMEQKEFAALVGCTLFQISRWERGRVVPSPLAVKALRALRIASNTPSRKSRKLKQAS